MSLPPVGFQSVAAPHHLAAAEEQAALLIGKLVPKIVEEFRSEFALGDIINPHASEAQQKSMEWIRNYGQLGPIVLTEENFQKVEEYRIGFLLGRAHPHASKELLIGITNAATWLFAYDDIVEHVDKKSIIQKWHARTSAIIKGEDATEKDEGLMKGLSEIMSQLRPFLTPEWQARINKEADDYLEATLTWEMENRIQKRYPDVVDYKDWRPKTSGTRFMFYLKGVEQGINLPDEVFERKDFQKVFDAAVDIVNFANDIISAPKETKDGMHNLVFAYKNTYKLGYEEALNHASRDLRERINEFKKAREDYSGPHKEEVERFFSGIYEWDIANFLWSVKWSENDSDRYIRHWKKEDGSPYQGSL